jgi:phosphoribosylformylglycinamidine cyclo-ligase
MGNGFVTLGYNNVIHSLTDLSCTSPLFVPATIIDSIDSTDMDPDIHERILRGMMEACLDFPQPYPRIVGGECAQLKGTIADHQYNFNVTATGFVDRIHVLNPKGNIRPGNVVVGFASDGIHLNGFSLQRAILESFCLDGTPEGSEETFLQLLIRRQPNYAKIIRTIAIEGLPIVALAHITGGGLFDNNLRNLPEDCRMVIDASAWEVPFFMKWLVENGQVEPFEAYRSWNMGIGFTVTCFNMAEAEMCVSLAKKLGQKAYIIGGIVEGDCGVEILLP